MSSDRLPEWTQPTVDDAPGILRLFERAFGEWPRVPLDGTAIAHLEWKMSPPEPLVPRHSIGTLDGEIVAADLRWMAETHVGAEVLLANGGAEIAVDPRYQGRGFSRALRESPIRRNQPGVLSISTPNDARADRYLPDPEGVRALPRWVLPLGFRGSLGVLRSGGLAATLRRLRRRSVDGSRYRIEVIERFGDRFDALWERARPAFDLAKVRRSSYLNWRYADPRSGRTLLIAAWVRDELAGYAVFRAALPAADLLDLVVDPAERQAAVALLEAGGAHLRERGTRSVSAAWPSGHPDEPALVVAGFVQAGPALVVRVSRPEGRETDLREVLQPRARWHVTLGDFEFA